jgi:NAD(P)-dependent dehydrogenase (short-subunit alcohol dehydrogenase family)
MKTNRVVVITGAAGGMGSVLVHRFLMNGDTVIATDIKSAPLEELREKHNADALITTVGDISKEKDCASLAELLRSKTTRVDVLINCAGYYPICPFEEMSLDECSSDHASGLSLGFRDCAPSSTFDLTFRGRRCQSLPGAPLFGAG